MAIVTGGTRGIGRAIATELARRGADIAFNYAQSVESAETLKSELEGFGVAGSCGAGADDFAGEDAGGDQEAECAFAGVDRALRAGEPE